MDADTGSLCPGAEWRGEGDGWDHGEEEEEEDKHELWDPQHTNTQKHKHSRHAELGKTRFDDGWDLGQWGRQRERERDDR